MRAARAVVMDAAGLFVVSLIIGLVVLAFVADHYGAKRWAAFSAAHHCKLVSHMDGNTLVMPVVNANGGVSVASTYVPGKDGYLCDDGVTYYRDN